MLWWLQSAPDEEEAGAGAESDGEDFALKDDENDIDLR